MKPLKLVLPTIGLKKLNPGGKLTNTEISPLIGKTDCRNLSFHKGALSSFKKHIGKTLNVWLLKSTIFAL